MAGYANPIPSATGSIAFSRLPADEIRRISVKRIYVTPTLDSLLNPVPGGLYDPALGAIKALDVTCTTCRMNEVHCSGHCGHIELPVACYHPQYIDTTLRVLRSKCLYCHKLRLPRNRIRLVVNSLKLLQYGLAEEYENLHRMRIPGKKRKLGAVNGVAEEIGSESEEVDAEDLMERQDKFVRKAIRRAKKVGLADATALLRNPAAIAARKEIIGGFLRDAALSKKCASCQGITPTYRKDRSVKIFKMPLSSTQRDAMRQAGMKAVNPLLFRMAEEKEFKPQEKPLTNGWHGSNDEMADGDAVSTGEPHGAEEEIALMNALETTAEAKTADLEEEDETQQYMTPTEVRAALDLLFSREQDIMQLLFAPSSKSKNTPVNAEMFFITHILVPPNRFRPAAKQGAGEILEAQQNGTLNRIIKAANDVNQIAREMRMPSADPSARRRGHGDHVNAGVILQEAVNGLIDHAPNPSSGRQNELGIKQTLEKKEGLFRMNMMGKRVNFAARSVISPDPNIETNEVGVPLVFARKLTYPEPVTSHNFEELNKAVINGMDKYPGAAAIENEKGQVLSLKNKSEDQRRALAKQLLTPSYPGLKGDRCKKVHRHLQSGDVVIMNRQPTLHKPSMMGHRARVLQNEKTIRMHYANCNTYNADFDGDEMNMHFPQNEVARAEALQIADTDHQYLSATAGKPLRGLIQDHLSMGVQFCSRDVFFEKDQYQELLYSCLRPEDNHTIYDRIKMMQPALLKPKRLWTGKQIISTVLKNIVPDRYDGLNLLGKTSTSADNWGETTEKDPSNFDVTSENICFRDTEQVVIFKGGEHLCGILDKAQLGPSSGGLVHSLHELYGHIIAGKFLSILGRLLTRYLAERAWTCGMDDLYLTKEGDKNRREQLSISARLGWEVSANYVTLKPEGLEERDPRLLARLEDVLRHDDQAAGLDQMYNSRTKTITENVTKACLPLGLRKPFPRNQMQAMTISGAKGSNVNANLISCNLGQQVLEGRRVPIMVSGKTLPSFREYETDPVAGGYISGRFLTGIKPQEYFFHAMSGREGLIDTAVKTSKSGYLQRCIVKGLEGLKTEYDISVREASNGTVVQFLYGEDGLEITKQKHLTEFTFLAENSTSVAAGLNIEGIVSKIELQDLGDRQKAIIKSVKKNVPGSILDPLMASLGPARNVGSTSESFAIGLTKYLKDNPDKLIRDKKKGIEGAFSKKSFQRIMDLKYMKSLVDPGEAVGVVAAQSVGEPSTQMTLNTFHLAGHSSKNVTLGIPRLREIVMTASTAISTPTMTLKVTPELPYEQGVQFAKGISRLSIAQVFQALSITERAIGGGKEGEKIFDVAIDLYPPREYTEEYAITITDVDRSFRNKFIPRLEKLIKTEFRKKSNEAALTETTAAVPNVGISVGRVEEARPEPIDGANREGGEDDIDEDADPDDAKQTATKERREDLYDEPDEDEVDIAEATDDSGSDGEDDSNHIQPKLQRSKVKKSQTLRELDQDDLEAGVVVDDSEDEERLVALQAANPHVKKFIFTRYGGVKARLILGYPVSSPKILLLPILEKAAHDAVIQSIPGINNCACFQETVKDPETGKNVMLMNEEKKESVVTTEGVNLKAIHDYQDIINPHTIYTNSIHDMLELYGVEAARGAIIREIDNVFKGHGISVDNRHLNLIADAMTQSGGYKAFSRNGIVKESGSVLGKMSFETVMGFLKEAVLFGESDPLLGPSARIVAGRRGRMGTGSFDVVVPVS